MAHVQTATVLLLMLKMCMAACCPTFKTGNVDQEKLLLLTEIAKLQILLALHLEEKPNITFPVSDPALQEAMKKLISSQEDPGQMSRVEGREYKVLPFAKPGPSLLNKTRLHFNVDFNRKQRRSIEIVQASLYLFWPVNSQQRVTVRPLLQKPDGSNLMLIGEREVELKEKGWSMLEVGSAAQTCFSQGYEVLTVDLETESQQELPLLLTNMSSYQPFIIAKVRELPMHHLHRRDLECDRRSRCCKKSFYLNFMDIGWHDWIISPPGFHINYCTGLCKKDIAGVFSTAASNHDFLLSNLRDMIVNCTESSCCVPTAFRSLTLMYFIQNRTIVLSRIPNMIIDACSCS